MSPCWLGLLYTKFEVGERLDPKIGGGETEFPCALLHFNPWYIAPASKWSGLHQVKTFLRLYNIGSYMLHRSSVTLRAYSFFANVNSVCRLWSVTLVWPTQAVHIFGNIYTALCTLAIR